MTDTMPKELARCLAAGTKDPMPRGICPRCGQNVALVRDQSRTIVHGCNPVVDDELSREYNGNPFNLAFDMSTGEMVRDLGGEAAKAYQRIRQRDELRARLHVGTVGESRASVTADVKMFLELCGAHHWTDDDDDYLLLLVALVRQSMREPAAASRCRELADQFCPTVRWGHLSIGREAFDALRRVLGEPE
jgi:hypothetical protein